MPNLTVCLGVGLFRTDRGSSVSVSVTLSGLGTDLGAPAIRFAGRDGTGAVTPRYPVARTRSLVTVFQFRAVALSFRRFSQNVWVSFAAMTPSGYHR